MKKPKAKPPWVKMSIEQIIRETRHFRGTKR
jgi:hypothetical protein